MFDFILTNLKKGIEKIKNNPQLFYTALVALLIIGAFIFITERFVSIANDAGERLINVRIGSIQDSFVSFAKDKIDDPEYLNKKILEIINANETIKTFNIIVKKNIAEQSSTTSIERYQYIVLASNEKEKIGKTDMQASFLYSLASTDINNSLTIALESGNERLFQTARAIKDEANNIIAVVMTTQTLSQADKIINNNIKDSIILLIFIIILILFLFFRFSKIIDYMELYKKLKAVDQLKDDFISMASHELRTPLSIIRGYAEYIYKAKELLPETKDFAQKIDISAKNLDDLVEDVLNVSQIQQGQMSFLMEKINPSEIIDNVVKSFILPAQEKGLSIFYDKNEINNETIILVDKNRLKQVLVNFIGNAIKYTQKGEIKIQQYIENNYLYIRISDTGIGMNAEEQKKLFEKFYRIRTKETKNIRGTGLGLWITAQIVKEMKGDISVESIEGVGSHFIISFPIMN
ncbi:MAG: HAMP domain-containing sensor histidine kinase [bacterium]